MNNHIILWGPNSTKRPVPPTTLDGRCPVDAGWIVWDEGNKRAECESCGQPIRDPKPTPQATTWR